MKYLNHKFLGIVVFSAKIGHDVMADKLGRREDITGAGFIEMDRTSGNRVCFGHSSRLGVGSCEADSEALLDLGIW